MRGSRSGSGGYGGVAAACRAAVTGVWLAVSTAAWAGSTLEDGDWALWRGPHQDGSSRETGLRGDLSLTTDALRWTYDIAGRGTPVVSGSRVYVWGYEGSGADLAEVLLALDLVDGHLIWKKTFRDFLSDVIYDRYSIGAPAVDLAGRVYVQTSAGDLVSFEEDGTERWRVPMMESLGRLTFPNGRTGAPVLFEGLVLVHGITANWGGNSPGRDRFYAFDADTGALMWVATPGTAPLDSSFSMPVIREAPGRDVLYAGTGCGHLAAIDVATGEVLWRAPVAQGGVNVSPVLTDDGLAIVSHAVENLDSTRTGGMFAIRLDGEAQVVEPDLPPVNKAVAWRNDIDAATSSPTLGDGVLYQVNQTGDLYAVDPANGAILWQKKLGTDQVHASPVFADGKLYVPMRDGTLWVLRPSRTGAEELAKVRLEGEALGAPAIAHGRILVLTTRRLYVFGADAPIEGSLSGGVGGVAVPWRLRVWPAEVILRPGEQVAIHADVLDAAGQVLRTVIPEKVTPFIPPTAKVKSEMKAVYHDGMLTAPADAGLTAGAFKVVVDGLEGTFRGRTVSGVPYAQDFEGFPVTEPDPANPAEKFGWPPLPWIGARFKWDVRQRAEGQVLAKTINNPFFQRSLSFIGHPDEHDYTMTVDVMSDGDARQMSVVGVVHQRYIVALKGNQRVLEVSSNQDRLKQSAPFVMTPGVWYRLKTEVVAGPDGVVTVRAKAWARDAAEPDAWTIEVRHADGHRAGAPGIFGFTPQNLHKVYLDNLVVAPNGGR
jgi:outer membrane protein assembly factor BamB